MPTGIWARYAGVCLIGTAPNCLPSPMGALGARRSSYGLEGSMQARTLADNAAAIADFDTAVAFGVLRRQWTSTECRKPKPEQMTLAFGLGPILEGGAVVQHRVVVHELH